MKILVAAVLITLSGAGCRQPAPSDESMISIFVSHRDVFENLRTMIFKDGYSVISMDPEWSQKRDARSDSTVPADVKRRYFPLFRQIHIRQLQSGKDGSAAFLVWAVGLGGNGDYKWYQYRPARVENLVDSLDSVDRKQQRIVFYHRKIADDWYLQFDHWP
jgi:hypothetical protein